MGKIDRLLGICVIGTIFSIVLRALFRTPFRLVEDAIAGWVNRQLAEVFGVTDPSVSEVVSIFAEWGPPFIGVLAIIGVGYAIGALAQSQRSYRVASPPSDPGEKDSELINLSEAVLIAYEETRGTKVATIAEGLNRDDILGYYAHALFDGKTTLYGNHPPSRKLEAVPNEEYGRCGFSDDKNALQRHGENRNLYENLKIKRSDVDRRIAELKSAATAPHEVRLSDALYWIIDNSGWGPGLGRDSFLDQAEIALRQAARDEEITIRGRREISRLGAGDRFDQTWEDIEPSYWRTHKFEMTAVMCAEPHYAACETAALLPMDIIAELMPHYAMLRVWNDELERLWPAANT